MRVALVAGPDPGHAFPAIALCKRFAAAGNEPILFTGNRWLADAAVEGIPAQLLKGLAPRPVDDDADIGQRIHQRAAYMATELIPDLQAVRPDVVVSDILTASGGLAAEKLGVPWAELSPHPLYEPSKGLPPIGSGLDPGTGIKGRVRDSLLRAATKRSIRRGVAQRGAARVGLGLPEAGPGPDLKLIATLPALEVPRPDWPSTAHVVGPLHWEPTSRVLDLPPGDDPLVVVAPSTAFTGAVGMVEAAVEGLAGEQVRIAISTLDHPPADLPANAVAGLGRQDALLAEAAVVVCGAGHGVLSKALLAGVPVVAIPGGGDQWELANRAARQGSAVVVRPLTAAAVRDAVRDVLADPRFRRNARAAAESAATIADPIMLCHRLVG